MKTREQVQRSRPINRRFFCFIGPPFVRGPSLLVLACTTGGLFLTPACSSTIHGDRIATAVIVGRNPGSGEDLDCQAPTDAVTAVLAKVTVDPAVPCPVQRRVSAGFGLALSALERHAECRALFARFGADGIEVLRRTRFRIASLRQEKTLCRRSGAFTTVGGRVTVLCRNFAYISDADSAVMLLHEALHHAGQGEFPRDRLAPTSFEITQSVTRSCGFTGT